MSTWTQVAADLAREFAGAAADVDREGRFPLEHVERLRGTGYLAMSLPSAARDGVPDLAVADLAVVCRAQRALARGCASTALSVNMHLFAVGFHAEAARAGELVDSSLLRHAAAGKVVGGTFAGALGAGADDAVRARPIPGGYVVSGRRPFCSMAPALDLCFCVASVVPGPEGDVDEPHPAAIAFWLPRATRGLRFEDTWDTLGMRGTGSFDVVLDDVLVPHLLVAPLAAGDGEWTPAAERVQAWFALTISAVYLGVADAAADVALRAVAGGARTGPTDTSTATRALGRGASRIAGEIGVGLATASALLEDTLRRREAGALTPADIAAVKLGVTQHAAAVGERCLALAGGRSLARSLGLERRFRDLQAGRFHPPGDEQALAVVGDALLAAGGIT